jgi:hypothetical protein
MSRIKYVCYVLTYEINIFLSNENNIIMFDDHNIE